MGQMMLVASFGPLVCLNWTHLCQFLMACVRVGMDLDTVVLGCNLKMLGKRNIRNKKTYRMVVVSKADVASARLT